MVPDPLATPTASRAREAGPAVGGQPGAWPVWAGQLRAGGPTAGASACPAAFALSAAARAAALFSAAANDERAGGAGRLPTQVVGGFASITGGAFPFGRFGGGTTGPGGALGGHPCHPLPPPLPPSLPPPLSPFPISTAALEESPPTGIYAADMVVLERNSRDYAERLPVACENASRLVEFLREQPGVATVFFPDDRNPFGDANHASLFDAFGHPGGGRGPLFSILLENRRAKKQSFSA